MNVLALLTEMNCGRTMDDLEERFQEVLEAVVRTKRGGTVTVTFDIKPSKEQMSNQIFVHADVGGKIPHLERSAECLYLDSNCHLSRRDPRQPENKMKIPAHDSMDRKPQAAGGKA